MKTINTDYLEHKTLHGWAKINRYKSPNSKFLLMYVNEYRTFKVEVYVKDKFAETTEFEFKYYIIGATCEIEVFPNDITELEIISNCTISKY
jgi:hypothetical protein